MINLLKKAGRVKQLNISTNMKSFLINEIKVDLVNYPYEWISPCDFIDIYFLLEKYSLSDLLKLYNQKYPDGSDFLVLRSLNYFEDADLEIMPVMINNITWDRVKNRIKQEVQSHMKS